METGQWLSLLGICLLGAMSPGPSLAVVLRSAVAGGKRAGLTAAFAHGAGVGLYGLLTVAGLALVITNTPAVYLLLQIGGALYLIYLGLHSLRPSSEGALAYDGSGTDGSAARDGFLVAFLNPKLAVFMLALFSQFLRPEFGMYEKTIMVFTVGFTDALWYALVASLVSGGGFLAKLRNSARTIDRAFGIILIALALSVIANALLK
jgi:threonine/homoserine/homoserine lactone efflux protein